MHSDEDFSLVRDDDSSSNLSAILSDIDELKTQYDDLQKENELLIQGKQSNLAFTGQFEQRTLTLRQRLDEDKMNKEKAVEKEQEKLSELKKENNKLSSEVVKIQQELENLHRTHQSLRTQTEVSTAVPEKKVVFNGETAEEHDDLSFDVRPHIVYPMEGGTAFVTFEDEEVAKNILTLREHEVQLGECSITVRAEPVQFLVPGAVEMDTQVCPRRILVSNLPMKVSPERILDKLEIHFSKTRNGGGEVEDVVLLEDSGNVVITFMDNNIAKGLTDKHTHEIEVDKGKRVKVKVTPFLNGDITLLKTRNTTCSKTVLLTGIPTMMDKETLQDLLEIHYQKSVNSGGEVETIVYNPLGERTLAVFTEETSKPE